MKQNDYVLLMKRYIFLCFGLALMALGIGFSVKAKLGTSPISSLPYVVSLLSPFTVGQATIAMHCVLISMQIALLRRRFEPVQLAQLPIAWNQVSQPADVCSEKAVAQRGTQPLRKLPVAGHVCEVSRVKGRQDARLYPGALDRLNGGDELVGEGSVIIEGSVHDRYSMDEYEGILRVFATTSWSEYKNNETYYSFGISNANVSLYCIDISDFSVVASVENFAPYGESVQSARFDGDTAYVCTAIELSDPVFFFDLSDLDNITYKHTGTIEGFSTSLIDFGEGFSVGIGVGSYGYLKIEAYVEDGDNVTPLCSYEADAYYSENYKSYYIDRENGLIGLGITDYSYEGNERGRYILLHFDGYKFTELVNVPLVGEGQPAQRRPSGGEVAVALPGGGKVKLIGTVIGGVQHR